MMTNITLDEAAPGMRVRYVPYHAHGDLAHKDCEDGIVSSKNNTYIFVRFKLGAVGQACKQDQLVRMR